MLTSLLALQQADTAFPNGSFAFSNGMEGLSAIGTHLDAPALAGVLGAVLRHRWAPCKRIAVVLAWRNSADWHQLATLDEALEAATLPESQRRGSRRSGAAFLATHTRLATPGAANLQDHLNIGDLLGHLPVMQGALWQRIGLDEPTAALVSGYTAASGMTSAAVRLGAIGAIGAQLALQTVLPLIAELSQSPIGDGDGAKLSGALPWLDVACGRQQTAAPRLFAN